MLIKRLPQWLGTVNTGAHTSEVGAEGKESDLFLCVC